MNDRDLRLECLRLARAKNDSEPAAGLIFHARKLYRYVMDGDRQGGEAWQAEVRAACDNARLAEMSADRLVTDDMPRPAAWGSAGLVATDAECAAVAVAPRVALADIEAAIVREITFTGDDAAMMFDAQTPRNGPLRSDVASLTVLTVCILVLRNGYTIIGKAAPASPANFDADLGRKLAREDAIRQVWPLMGYALRDRLAEPSALELGAEARRIGVA